MIKAVRGAAAFGALWALSFAAGCGGSDNAGPSIIQSGSVFAGRSYQTVFTLDGTNKATAKVNVGADGTASGTFSLDNGTAARAVFATGNLTGTVNLSDGTVNLNGTILNDGSVVPVSITGNLGSTARLAFNETFYTANWTVFTSGGTGTTGGGTTGSGTTGSGTTAGTTTGGTTGSGGGVSQGSFSDITFSAVSGANITSSGTNLKAVSGLIITQNLPYVGAINTITVVDTINGVARSISIVYYGTITAGQTMTIDNDKVGLTYSESQQGQTVPRSFNTTGGTLTVNSVSGKVYKFTINNATFAKSSPPTVGVGTFTLNGTLTAQAQ